MRTLVILLAAVALGLWSLFAWAVAGLAGAAGSLAAVNADLLPLPPEWVVLASDLFATAGAFAPTAVWIVWGFGAAILALLAGIGLVLTANRRRSEQILPPGGPSFDPRPFDPHR